CTMRFLSKADPDDAARMLGASLRGERPRATYAGTVCGLLLAARVQLSGHEAGDVDRGRSRVDQTAWPADTAEATGVGRRLGRRGGDPGGGGKQEPQPARWCYLILSGATARW